MNWVEDNLRLKCEKDIERCRVFERIINCIETCLLCRLLWTLLRLNLCDENNINEDTFINVNKSRSVKTESLEIKDEDI